MLGIAERDWQTKEARNTDNASKKAIQAVLEKHEAELLRPMESEARKRVAVSNNTDDGFSLATATTGDTPSADVEDANPSKLTSSATTSTGPPSGKRARMSAEPGYLNQAAQAISKISEQEMEFEKVKVKEEWKLETKRLELQEKQLDLERRRLDSQVKAQEAQNALMLAMINSLKPKDTN